MEAVALMSSEETLHGVGIRVGQVGHEGVNAPSLLQLYAELVSEGGATSLTVVTHLFKDGINGIEGVVYEEFFGGHSCVVY